MFHGESRQGGQEADGREERHEVIPRVHSRSVYRVWPIHTVEHRSAVKGNKILTRCNTGECQKRHTDSKKPDIKVHVIRLHFSKCPEQANLWRQRAAWRFPGARHGNWIDQNQAWRSFLGDGKIKKLDGSDGCTNSSIC